MYFKLIDHGKRETSCHPLLEFFQTFVLKTPSFSSVSLLHPSSLISLDDPGDLPVRVDDPGLLHHGPLLGDDGQVEAGGGAAVAEEADAQAALDDLAGLGLGQPEGEREKCG